MDSDLFFSSESIQQITSFLSDIVRGLILPNGLSRLAEWTRATEIPQGFEKTVAEWSRWAHVARFNCAAEWTRNKRVHSA